MLRIFLAILLISHLGACASSNQQETKPTVAKSESQAKKSSLHKKSGPWLIKDTRFWTVFNTGYKTKKGVGIRLSLPPGALVIRAPVVQVDVSSGFREYELLSAGYNFSGDGPSEMHVTFVLFDISKYKGLSLQKISRKMQVDRKLFFHNSHLSWFKNSGKETNIKGTKWLHRVGRSTGPNTKSRLQLKSEDAYLARLDARYALGVYGTYYDSLKKNPGMDDITRKIVENIKLTSY